MHFVYPVWLVDHFQRAPLIMWIIPTEGATARDSSSQTKYYTGNTTVTSDSAINTGNI